ncbi:MAG: alpha/beta fold hydrolase [Vampirovibrionales bacterium]|nr:alpha/beta fold hydrolase [Vampirovibrionales bacterium]
MIESQKLALNNDPFYWPNHHQPFEGHAILLLHGLGGGIYELRPVGETLYPQGFSVRGINYPGHGEPYAKMPRSYWQDWYHHCESAYLELAQTHQHVSLIGFSTGCPLALKLAHTYPVKSLVLLSPFLEIKRPLPMLRLEPLVHATSHMTEYVPRLGLPIKDSQTRKDIETFSYIKTFNLRSVQSALSLINEVKSLVPKIDTSTLIIQSPHDRVVDPSGAHFLNAHLGSIQKELYWLKRSDHLITLDLEREIVYSKILEFLSTL